MNNILAECASIQDRLNTFQVAVIEFEPMKGSYSIKIPEISQQITVGNKTFRLYAIIEQRGSERNAHDLCHVKREKDLF